MGRPLQRQNRIRLVQETSPRLLRACRYGDREHQERREERPHGGGDGGGAVVCSQARPVLLLRSRCSQFPRGCGPSENSGAGGSGRYEKNEGNGEPEFAVHSIDVYLYTSDNLF